MIHFTRYANGKFSVLEEHEFSVSRDAVADTVWNPESVDTAKTPLFIARKKCGGYDLKVVYKKEGNMVKVITFYPALPDGNEKR